MVGSYSCWIERSSTECGGGGWEWEARIVAGSKGLALRSHGVVSAFVSLQNLSIFFQQHYRYRSKAYCSLLRRFAHAFPGIFKTRYRPGYSRAGVGVHHVPSGVCCKGFDDAYAYERCHDEVPSLHAALNASLPTARLARVALRDAYASPLPTSR